MNEKTVDKCVEMEYWFFFPQITVLIHIIKLFRNKQIAQHFCTLKISQM